MSSFLPTPPAEGSTPANLSTVYLPSPFHPKAETYAETRFARVLRPGQDGLTADDCLAQADGILLRIANMGKTELDKATKCRIICRNGTGTDMIDLAVCKERGIAVTNRPGGNAKAVAELTLTLTLSVLRRVKELDYRICSGEIVPSIRALAPGLHGKTVGLIGMGDIAYEFALLLQPFGIRLLVFSPSSPESRWRIQDNRYPVTVQHERVSTLEEFLRQSDVVSIHCPLTPGTRGLLGDKEMGWMKEDAVVINTARGGIIDEEALARALKEGKLGGAGLDVFEIEPAHAGTLGELGKMPNVICLPHLGGSTDSVTLDGCVDAVNWLADYLDGKSVPHRVV
ncbi:putative phosphoglycerate dehydrogenase [Naematelia encephala]|uniref:Putative phosphoglycerate dehydrogenase n=1 Tax=Naematelia encephala TaxID=71784 RepID=A0A1Y2BED7_9TREE|nr:putative phosphoglycerate dehydrogenase [Naematelia encephala]